MLARPERRIELRPEDGMFVVEVLPPPTEGANFDGTFASYKAARGYAGGVRMVTGWQVADLVEAHDGQG